MAEKKKRRQSKVFSDLCPRPSNPLENEELIKHYTNKDYKAPLPSKYETLFEGPRRGCSEEGELIIGKSVQKRYIEDYQYWKQSDKDRNKRRKMMIHKLFKGRKRVKNKPLTLKDEEKLARLIENVPVQAVAGELKT